MARVFTVKVDERVTYEVTVQVEDDENELDAREQVENLEFDEADCNKKATKMVILSVEEVLI